MQGLLLLPLLLLAELLAQGGWLCPALRLQCVRSTMTEARWVL
jgi:hypothetical protein